MYCVECHMPTDPKGLDFTQYSVVFAHKAEIRCGVGPVLESGCTGFPPPKQFPIDNATKSNPKPDDAARAELVKWIDDGAPQ